MTPEHFQLIISDLYEENYKSDFAKDLRENIDNLTDFDWFYQYKISRRVGGGGRIGGIGSRIGCFGGGVYFGVVGVGSGVGSRVGGVGMDGFYVGGGGGVGMDVGGDN